VLASDQEPDGDALSAIVVKRPRLGSVRLFPNGAFIYQAGAASRVVRDALLPRIYGITTSIDVHDARSAFDCGRAHSGGQTSRGDDAIMTSKQKQRIGMGAAAAVIVIGGVVFALSRQKNAALPDRALLLCMACKNEFTMTLDDLHDHDVKHKGENVTCPKCGKPEAVLAVKCQSCGATSPLIRGMFACPVCGKPLRPAK
jgi:DNA-directed RNA polymerase subunit RPC12/RpoP